MTLYETVYVDESLFLPWLSFQKRVERQAVSMGNGRNGLTGLAAIQLLELEEREKESGGQDQPK